MRRTRSIFHRRPALATSAARGSVLVEFALISLAFYLLMAGTIELGRAIASSQVIQNAARVGARELAMLELPATMTFEEALQLPEVRAQIYDPSLLVVNVSAGEPNTDLWPVVNRMLLPVMVRTTVGGTDGGTEYLQYPGAIVASASEGLTVAVPHVVSRDPVTGAEQIRWLSVVEEVRADPDDPHTGPFSVSSTGPQKLLVALRINCPYQAATLSAMQPNPETGAMTQPILADDDAVSAQNPAPGTLIGASSDSGLYSGPYGLGKFYAFGAQGQDGVRPFRRLLSAQAIFRREVFQ